MPHEKFITKVPFLYNITRTVEILKALLFIKVFIILCGGDLFEGGLSTISSSSKGVYSRVANSKICCQLNNKYTK